MKTNFMEQPLDCAVNGRKSKREVTSSVQRSPLKNVACAHAWLANPPPQKDSPHSFPTELSANFNPLVTPSVTRCSQCATLGNKKPLNFKGLAKSPSTLRIVSGSFRALCGEQRTRNSGGKRPIYRNLPRAREFELLISFKYTSFFEIKGNLNMFIMYLY